MDKTLNVPGTWGEPADSVYIDPKKDFSYPIPFRDHYEALKRAFLSGQH